MLFPPARRSAPHAFAATALAAAALLLSLPAAAQSTTYINGTLTAGGRPVAGVVVHLSGNNVNAAATSGPEGRFTFATLPVGRYTLVASQGNLSATTTVDLTSAGDTVALALAPIQEIGRTAISSRAAVQRRGGTDVTLNHETLTRLPSSGNFSEVLLQVPGAARGANGVVHLNGDHGDLNYVVDGVSLPQELNRVIGSEVDPSNVGFAEVLQGAYPAQYGEKFGAVLNLSTRSGETTHGLTFDATGGSFSRYDSTFGYHAPIGPAGSLVLALRNERDGRALDPPSVNNLHDAGSNANQFVRLTLPHGGSDFVNLTLTHAFQTYQIPPDLSNGAAPRQDDNEHQDDLFASLQYRHAIGEHGSFSFGPSVKRSRITDFPDVANDIAGTGGAGCANDVTACGFGVFADRTSVDVRLNADYALRSANHEVRAGAIYDVTSIAKNYVVTLQAPNPLPRSANNAVTDTAPNSGHTQEAYLQDSWRMGARYQLDYGVRADMFQVASTEFRSGSAQFSPRVKLTRFIGDKASVYAYYGRFFTPYSFENLSPAAAARLQPQSGNFDLLPQRDSVYEIGGHLPIGRGDLGLRVMHKNATDVIDDTAVGSTNLHQDINFKLGRIATQTAYYQLTLPRNGRFYLSATHTYSVVKNCETQLLAPCFSGPTLDWTPADHDQRYDANAGWLVNDRRGGWFSIDGEYGSGLSTAASDATVSPAFRNPFCPPDPATGTGSNFCKVPPHLTFDAEKGFALGHATTLTLRVGNLFNDRYHVTLFNAQGNHVVRPRSFELGLRIGRE
ncbi:MAG: TonB-dependent receptor domain-containing protein [Candidatus Velthaea sp.]